MQGASEQHGTHHEDRLAADDLREVWAVLSPAEQAEGLVLLPRDDAEELFFSLAAREQAHLIAALPPAEQRTWMRLLPPDDSADVIQHAPAEQRERLLSLLDDFTRKEVSALLAYAEDDAGGLMNPRYARVRPDQTVDEAITYLRKQTRERVETIYYAYAIDADQKLLGVTSFRDLFSAQAGQRIRDVMRTDLVTVRDTTDQEALSQLFAQSGLIAIPVVDEDGRMKGIVTFDDIVEVVSEEATEDIQKLGGSEALSAPYLQVGFREMIQKRAGWLSVLLLGEMLTATAMGYFEDEIAKAVVLAVFVPLIISSGGNSGSQATSIVIRAMALGELKLKDWYRVVRRELGSGLALGGILGALGFLRVVVWESLFKTYGSHFVLIAFTVALSLVGVVMFGTLAGSLLPFVLRRLGFDPASASAPFVATLVDVTGLVIYFTAASLILGGTLL
jgi:magnesium transporter